MMHSSFKTLSHHLPRKWLQCGCMVILLLLTGCGFQLRGTFNIAPELRVLKIEPDQPYDPFQRNLRQAFKANCVTVLDWCDNNNNASILKLSNVNFTERTVAYGSDVQVNRVTLQFSFSYQVVNAAGLVIVPCNTVDVERDLTINPYAVLGTENERASVKTELYNDATDQLIRQLSNSCLPPSENR